MLIAMCLMAALLAGCKTSKQTALPPTPVVLNNTDSVAEKTTTVIEYVQVPYEVAVPAQSMTNIALADTSHVETDIAASDAWLRSDGTLYHTIVNKATTLKGEATTPVTTTTKETQAVKVRELAVPQPYAVEVERSLTTSQRFKLATFWYLLGALALSIGYILRKPLLWAFQKLLSC